jgi:hypothetical protein
MAQAEVVAVAVEAVAVAPEAAVGMVDMDLAMAWVRA